VTLIDEPSQKSKEEQDEWWTRSMGGRLSESGAIIIVQSRTHEGDEPGHVISDGRDPWPHLVLIP
jgi:hypothetical protein